MPPSRATSERTDILFCPYCHDGFEDQIECPEHELILVPIDRLPRTGRAALGRVTFFADPRLGRGPVLIGATLLLLGFLAPFVRSGELVASALEVAIDGAGNLWFTPGAAIAILWILWRRRSRSAMAAARAAIFGLSIGAMLPLVYTTRRIGIVAEAFTANVEWRWGLWLMLVGIVAAGLGSRRLGGGSGRPLGHD